MAARLHRSVLVIGALLLLPHVFGARESAGPLKLGAPRVESGDEPHYLVILHSVIGDLDLDLADDYAAVLEGGVEAGTRFRGDAIDHHTSWFLDGRRVRWFEVYETDRARWVTDARGRSVPAVREGVTPPPPGTPEYSLHGFGQAVLLAPLLVALRGTSWVEPAAIVLSGLAVVVAMLAFRLLMGGLVSDRRLLELATVLAFLGTPIWHYGRSLFVEPYLLALALGAYALGLRRGRWVLAGVAIGAGVLMKPVFVLLAVPLGFAAGADRVRLGAPIAASLGIVLVANAVLHGSPFTPAQPWIWGSFFEGLFGLLFSVEHGLVLYAPAVLLALPGWIELVRKDRREALVLLAPAPIYLLVHAAWFDWGGGHCYGPRFLVPVIPFLFLGLAELPTVHRVRLWWSKIDIVVLAALSLVINALGALPYWRSWGQHPLWS